MRPLSIGLRWTVRYTAAMLLVVSAMAVAYYELAQRQARSDAFLLLELEANEILRVAERHASGAESFQDLVAYVDQHVASANPELRLGIRLLDASGRPRVARGLFEREAARLPEPRTAAPSRGRPVVLDLGDSFPYAVLSTPAPGGSVEVIVYTRRFLRGIRDLRNSMLKTVPIVFLLTAAVGWWLARSSLAPIARMAEASRRITASQLDEEIPRSGTGDELDELADTLNAMMERIRRGVESVRGFSSTAAHQLRTPLSRLRNRLEMAAAGERDPVADGKLIEEALGDVERLGEALRGMLRLADSEGGLDRERCRPVPLAPLLAEVVQFFEPVASEKRIRLALAAEDDAVVTGDPDWLREMFSNLLDNALKYTPAGGRVDVVVSSEAGRVAVAVRDDGPGIARERQGRIFERFERGPEREGVAGAGLGLTVAREIAHAHGGGIEVESEPGRGSAFPAWLPGEPAPGGARPARRRRGG